MGGGGGGGTGNQFFQSELARVNEIEPSAWADMPMTSGVGVSRNYRAGLRNPLYYDFLTEEEEEEEENPGVTGLPAGVAAEYEPIDWSGVAMNDSGKHMGRAVLGLFEMVKEAEAARAAEAASQAASGVNEAGLTDVAASTIARMR